MPILLNDLQALAAKAVKTYSPKFFDSKLTGRGGNTVGFLSAKNNPISIPATVRTSPKDNDTVRQTRRNGNEVTYCIPVATLPIKAQKEQRIIKRPCISDLCLIATGTNNKKLYIGMEPNTIQIKEHPELDNHTGLIVTKKDFRVNYALTFYSVIDDTVVEHVMDYQSGIVQTIRTSQNYAWRLYTNNPIYDMTSTILTQLKQLNWTVDDQAVMDYFTNYDLYAGVCHRSEEWQTTIDETIKQYIEQTVAHKTIDSAFDIVQEIVKYIMYYNIPLDLYKNIYASINKNFPADKSRRICKQNLNLLLSDTLNNLDSNKANIHGFTPSATAQALPANLKRLSKEQIKAVMSTEPLILVQAGAGTGKSTLILGRIDYLTHSGVNPNDITVLSFTNAAADNITAKNPNVHSMTIARMIHEIYTANFPNHELSSLDTILNSLSIYQNQIQTNAVNKAFQAHLEAMIKNDTNNFTEMNNFIEENYDAVMTILDTIGQTSLELEIMICYQKIDTLKEPNSIASKFLIIDEVQDNSIFEFVYTLKYVDKHKESLFIVGKLRLPTLTPTNCGKPTHMKTCV